MVAVAVICTPASVIVASMDRIEVMRWLDAPKRRPMISGTVVAMARRKSGATVSYTHLDVYKRQVLRRLVSFVTLA